MQGKFIIFLLEVMKLSPGSMSLWRRPAELNMDMWF